MTKREFNQVLPAGVIDLPSDIRLQLAALAVLLHPATHSVTGRISRTPAQSAHDIYGARREQVEVGAHVGLHDGVGHRQHVFALQVAHVSLEHAVAALHVCTIKQDRKNNNPYI